MIRRECIDHVIVFGECHLRHLLRSYLNYYNETRTHLSLDKDAPVLDKRASGQAKRAIATWFSSPTYESAAVSKTLVEVFDKLYT